MMTLGMAHAMLCIQAKLQNEILQIAADQIREFCRICLKKCSHFSILADEVTSHGKEILSVCMFP